MNRISRTLIFSIRPVTLLAALALLAGNVASANAGVPANPSRTALAKACEGRDGWSDPAPPAHVFGNTWYVGTCGITVLLITSPQGHVLIDGGPADAAPLVAANVEKLGFALKDIRWMIASHEHDDHVGGTAELQRLSGARVAALREQAAVLKIGKLASHDPQFAIAEDFAPVRVHRKLRPGGKLKVGALVVTATGTPTHSPGSTSWIWQSCEVRICRTIAYADSASTISADGYRFTAHPDREQAIRRGLAAIAGLPCDLLLTPHPSASNMFERFSGAQPLMPEHACRTYAEAALARFEARLERERQGTQP